MLRRRASEFKLNYELFVIDNMELVMQWHD